MAEAKRRLALDANVLIAGTYVPRWPYEVMRAAMVGPFDVLLPTQVIDEARSHVGSPRQRAALDAFLAACPYVEVPMPSRENVELNLDLVRDRSDVPLALSLLDAGVEIFVTNDRDFTDPGARAERFARQVRVMLSADFLKEEVGWSSDALESIRNRGWEDLAHDIAEGEPEP